ncbi:hypothetical protein LINPERHAP2_LOCUS29074, partial [Linum perenne]
ESAQLRELKFEEPLKVSDVLGWRAIGKSKSNWTRKWRWRFLWIKAWRILANTHFK